MLELPFEKRKEKECRVVTSENRITVLSPSSYIKQRLVWQLPGMYVSVLF